MKKTQTLKLDRLSETWPILKMLSENEASFPSLTGLHIEFDPEYNNLIAGLPPSLLRRCSKLSLVMMAGSAVGMPEDVDHFLETAYNTIQKTTSLQHLRLLPHTRDVKWIEMLVKCLPKLRMLQSLTINCRVHINRQGNYRKTSFRFGPT